MLKVNMNSQPIKRKVACMIKRPVSVQLFSTNRYSRKIRAMPFKFPRELVDPLAKVHLRADLNPSDMMKSVNIDFEPQSKEGLVTVKEVRKAYIPIWHNDIAVLADITPSIRNENKSQDVVAASMDPPRQILFNGYNCFWPGHTWDPICYLNCSKIGTDNYPGSLVRFTPKLYENSDIEVIPFTVNPFNDLSDRVPKAWEDLSVNYTSLCSEGSYKINNAQVLFHAAYPLYWPVYIVECMDKSKKKIDLQTTIVIGAESFLGDEGFLGPNVFEWMPNQSGVDQWRYNNNWFGVRISETEWYVGPNEEGDPFVQLKQLYLREVVGKIQTKQVNWEDERILPYTGNSQKENKAYLSQLCNVWQLRGALSRMEYVPDDQIVKLVKIRDIANYLDTTKTYNVSELRKRTKNELEENLEELEQSKPAWYKKYKNKSPSSSY